MDELMNDDIDYLHPDGKPLGSREPQQERGGQTEPPSDGAKPTARELDLALHEADGHSIYKPDPFLDGDETEPPRWDPKYSKKVQ